MKNLSLWEATANERTKRSALKGDEMYDVVIIGGGFTGLSVAYHLQQQNVKTAVLEQEIVGYGASGRNGGEVLSGYAKPMKDLTKKYGLDEARQMFQMSLDSIDLIEQIIHKENISCDFYRGGQLAAAYKPSHLDNLKREQEFLQKHFNFSAKILEKDEMHTEMASTYYSGGLVDEASAIFHPLNYCIGLAEAVERHGGTIYENTQATQIERLSADKYAVKTKNGCIFANQVGMFVNAYTTGLHKTIERALVPSESIMIATERLSDKVCKQLIRKNRAVWDTKNLLYYFRLTGDNRLAFGGSGRTFRKTNVRHLFRKLHVGMIDVFPALKDVKIEYRWSGKVGFTIEKVPYIGRLEDGTYFAFGYAGHGAAMSTLLGKIVAHNMLSSGENKSPLNRDDLKPIPFHGLHTMAVGLTKYYFKIKDALF